MPVLCFILKTKVSSKTWGDGGDKDECFSCDLTSVLLFKAVEAQMGKEIISSYGLALCSTHHLH